MDELPNDEEYQTCPQCGRQTAELGFGLAGGGYGAYLFCYTCEKVVEKWQEDDADRTETAPAS